MPAQRPTLRLVGDSLPEDFGQRLEQFMQVSGLGPRPLGRLVGVSPYRVREWRRGVVPSGHYLFRLLRTAESMGLGHLLMCPEETWSDGPDKSDGPDNMALGILEEVQRLVEALNRNAGQSVPPNS